MVRKEYISHLLFFFFVLFFRWQEWGGVAVCWDIMLEKHIKKQTVDGPMADNNFSNKYDLCMEIDKNSAFFYCNEPLMQAVFKHPVLNRKWDVKVAQDLSVSESYGKDNHIFQNFDDIFLKPAFL